MTTVISVEHLSKSYRLGQIGTGTFAYDLNVWWARMRGKPNPLARIGEADHGNRVGEEVWALKDISFKVNQGEVLGIIGRNGAGKSTLLKILSRVTAPTSGEIKVKGRVASLLEVGTGFHPDLTGRENVFLNGAILGMTRAEVARKFDEIVDFAGVEKFIDTPVKRYSSGMYVRLAFAVAAHLDPEILVVDEVLAVGDAEFQKKCLGKMGDVAHEGRTVLLVSHNMGVIRNLCAQAVVLEQGHISAVGPADDAVSSYLSRLASTVNPEEKFRTHRDTGKGFRDIWFENSSGRTTSAICGEEIDICFSYDMPERMVFDWGLTLYNHIDEAVAHFGSQFSRRMRTALPKRGTILCHIPRLPLPDGRYRLNAVMQVTGKNVDHIIGAAYLDVHPGNFFGTGQIPPPASNKVLVDHEWQVQEETRE